MKNLQKFLFVLFLFGVSNVVRINFATAQSALLYRGVDVMKFTKDTLNNQPTDAEIENIVGTIASAINPTHISISVPLDSSVTYPVPPTPRTAEAFTQKWAETIHAKGKNVIFRGTWSGIEGLYNFPKLDGSERIPAGTKFSAPTDGDSTWLGKSYQYIIRHPEFFADGDVWAIMPERTEGIFQDSTSFLNYGGAGIQTNYSNFFNDLKYVSDQAFIKIGKRVTTGLTANNYTEVASGWLPQSVFETAGMAVVDHYGLTHTPEEMEANIRKIFNLHGKPIFLQEWGDYWNADLPEDQRMAYLVSMFEVWQKLADEKILAGFNYWGGWANNLEGILVDFGNGTYSINERGRLLAKFYAANSALQAGSTEQFGQTPTPNLVPALEPVAVPEPVMKQKNREERWFFNSLIIRVVDLSEEFQNKFRL